jgi:hypothetical protein
MSITTKDVAKKASASSIAVSRTFIHAVRILTPMVLLAALCSSLHADELRFDSLSDWRTWDIPDGIVELGADGVIRPLEIRKNTNATLDAPALGGGVHKAGSNLFQAERVFDADPTTGWAPNAASDGADWFIEIDLGRAVSAHRVTLQFDESEDPFELFDLLLSTGEPAIDVVGNPIEGTLVYRVTERYKANNRHRVTFELDQPLHTPIRYVRVQPLTFVPGARLTEIEVEAFGDNLLTNLLAKGGNIEIVTAVELGNDAVALGNAFSLIDGDLVTRYSQRNEPRASFDIFGTVTLDLGAVFWADLVRIIGGVVIRSGGGGGITTAQFISRRNYIYRFYEILTSDGSLSPDGTRVWRKHFSDFATEEMKQRGLADHGFESLPARFIQFRYRVWDAACAFGNDGISSQSFTSQNCLVTGWTEEMQAFGEGFPQQVSMRSPLLDLGEGKNLNAVRWQADTPPGSRVEIRTRTGSEVRSVSSFHDKNGKEVTERSWGKLIPSFRGSIDTTLIAGADWSPWSTIYATLGERFQSPSPRRYLEVDVRLVTEQRDRAASLDWLAIDFSPPLAGRALGEITPSQVTPATQTEFSYFIRTEDSPIGFDRLTIEASTALEYLDTRIDGVDLEASSSPTEDGFVVDLPRRVLQDELIELRFATSVYLQSTRFDLFLENRRNGEQIRQRVDAGDASVDVESNSTVVSIPVGSDLFADIQVTPSVLTANGDGLNDEITVHVELVNVLSPRPLQLRLYDLSGRLVHTIQSLATAGEHTLRWDGRADGRLVPPGMYILEVTLQGDAVERVERRVIAVVY